MANNDEIWAAIFGGVVGAALAAPKPEDKQDLEIYRRQKQEILLRQQKIGKLPDALGLFNKAEYYNTFIEAYKMHLHGFFRGSIIVSTAVIESLLKDKYGDKKFYELIEKANSDKIIGLMDYHLLHGLRSERNDSTHNILREIREEDSQLVLQIVIRLINTIIQHKP